MFTKDTIMVEHRKEAIRPRFRQVILADRYWVEHSSPVDADQTTVSVVMNAPATMAHPNAREAAVKLTMDLNDAEALHEKLGAALQKARAGRQQQIHRARPKEEPRKVTIQVNSHSEWDNPPRIPNPTDGSIFGPDMDGCLPRKGRG